MPGTTTHYGWATPSSSDAPDIDAVRGSIEEIDTELYGVNAALVALINAQAVTISAQAASITALESRATALESRATVLEGYGGYGVLLTRTAYQDITNNSVNNLTWTTAVGIDGSLVTGSGPWTSVIIPTGGDGVYDIACSGTFEYDSTLATQRSILLYVNGAVHASLQSRNNPVEASSIYTTALFSGEIDLNAGDELNVRAYQNSGDTLKWSEFGSAWSIRRRIST